MTKKKETLLITGAHGVIAKHLTLISDDYHIKFLTRKKTKDNEYVWDLKTGYIDSEALHGVNHIIHLAGANIADKRWTEERKKEIIASRVDSANLIFEKLKEKNSKIDSFISASGVGYYGTRTTDRIFSEQEERGEDFLSEVCSQWEAAAKKFENENSSRKTVILRFGVVLSKQDGLLQKMRLPISLNVGAYFGNGKQFMPWIHVNDLCELIRWVLKNKTIQGIFNAASPEHITNKEFTDSMARHLHKRIWLPTIPPFVIKFLLGEISTLLLEGSRVSSEKIRETGFCFQYATLNKALENLLT